MSDDNVRVGIVGAGANTVARHIPGLQDIKGVEILGVCNRSAESSEKVAAKFGIPKIYEHWVEAVEDPEIEAIVIGTWPYMHCPVTLAALEEGKHVLTEARMAMNANEAYEMLSAAQEQPELVAQIVPSPMTLGVDRTIQRLLAEGYVGEVLAVEVQVSGDFIDRESPLHWRQNFDLSGLNIMGMGIYYEAIQRWLGSASRVMALGKTFVKTRRDGEGRLRSLRIPDHIDVLADMECGAQLHMQLSSVAAFQQGEGVYVFGSEGMLRFLDDKLFGARRGDSAPAEITIAPEDHGGWRVEEEFINAIRGRETVTHTSFEDGVKYMEFTEAVSLSLAGGRAVTLPLALDS